MNKDNKTNLFATTDLSLVAYLTLSYPIISVDKTDYKKVNFFFQKTHELESLIANFWADKALVEPKAYFYQLRAVKSRIYSKD